MLEEITPRLRVLISEEQRFISTNQDDEHKLQFINSNEAGELAELGTSCPDHFLRTKIKPLYIDWDPATSDLDALMSRVSEGLEQYRRDYTDYYLENREIDSPTMRDPNPRVILLAGLRMIAWGQYKRHFSGTSYVYLDSVR